MERRQEQAGEDFRLFNMPVASFRTYSNAVARVYSQVGATAIIPSSLRQFPTFNVFMGSVIARSRAVSAVRAAAIPETEILNRKRFLYTYNQFTKDYCFIDEVVLLLHCLCLNGALPNEVNCLHTSCRRRPVVIFCKLPTFFLGVVPQTPL